MIQLSGDLLTQPRYRKPLLIGAIVLGSLLFVGGYHQSYNSLTRSVTVVGIGRYKAKPEKAIISFSVLYEASTQDEAVTAGERRFGQLLDAVSPYKPTTVDKTTYQLTQRTAPRIDAARVTSGATYQYVNAARVTLADIGSVQNVVKALYDNGASLVTQVRYVPKDEQAADREARELAVKEAKIKAQQMAQASGARVGRVLTLQEGTATGATTGETGTPVSGQASGDNGADLTSVGEIEVQAITTATFELKPWWMIL